MGVTIGGLTYIDSLRDGRQPWPVIETTTPYTMSLNKLACLDQTRQSLISREVASRNGRVGSRPYYLRERDRTE